MQRPSPEVLDLFRRFKPYKGGNNILWALNKLCNSKKHCALVPFALGFATIFVGMGEAETAVEQHDGFRRFVVRENINILAGPIRSGSPSWDSENYEITLGSTPANKTNNPQPIVELNVTIDGVEPLQKRPAVAVLNAMVREVDRVLSTTEAECRRIGLVK